jgi:undecaprenyl-diphosphatase
MPNLDIYLTHSINFFAGHFTPADFLMKWISLGGPLVLVLLIAIRWFAKTDRIKQRHLAIICGLATALGLIINQLILLFYQRPRPYDADISQLIIERSADPSFPSDHATVAFAIVTALLLRKDRFRFYFLSFALLLCISRVFLGTHYFSDVVGGIATGALGALVITRLYWRLDPITQRIVRVL